MKKMLPRCLTNHWRVWLSIVATLVLLLGVWGADRVDIIIGDGKTGMKYIRIAQLVAGLQDESLPPDILAVNIGYDRQLTDVYDKFGLPMGKIDVTDRNALNVFCEAIREASYKSVMLDVFFDESLPADGDSALFATLNSMDRLVIPVHADGVLNPGINISKGASGDYTVTCEQSNFVKYPFYGSSGQTSMALAAYRHELDFTKSSKSNAGEGIFIQRSPILTLPITISGPYDADSRKTWYNLTTDLIECYTPAELAKLVEQKHVIIGDFTNSDFHDTYVGTLPGPLLHINALATLQHGRTTVKPSSALFLCIGYFLICWFIASEWTLWSFIPWKPGRFVGFLLGFIGFSAALLFIQIMEYAIFREFHDFWFATIFLSMYTILCQHLNKKYPVCNSIVQSNVLSPDVSVSA